MIQKFYDHSDKLTRLKPHHLKLKAHHLVNRSLLHVQSGPEKVIPRF